MALFQTGQFDLASGLQSQWKIECDSLTDEDWETIARQIANRIQFKSVVGVPTGGLKLARALWKYTNSNRFCKLIVDDVYTTGKSINPYLGHDCLGFVVFARSELPSNIKALWYFYDPVEELRQKADK